MVNPLPKLAPRMPVPEEVGSVALSKIRTSELFFGLGSTERLNIFIVSHALMLSYCADGPSVGTIPK